VPDQFLDQLAGILATYLEAVAEPREYLSLLRWQIAQGHRLDDRATWPGHVTTSALIVSPDYRETLLIDHIVIGRWLQPGGHYEPADAFHLSAMREAIEETSVTGLVLHRWHRDRDVPFRIDSHDVPGNPRRDEPPHVHHDLQYLFIADPATPLAAQADEVHAVAWKPIDAMADFAPLALRRIHALT
jgi:8-oxo-dGTP pyrophosphatase MutT (NUDIX family)